MIRVLPEQKIVLLENEALRVALDYSCGLHFAEFSNRFGAGKSNVWRELFTLRAYGGEYASETFTCTNVSYAKDEALEMATFLLENRELCMKMRVHLMDEGKRELRLTYQLWDDYKNGTPAEVFLHIPFLAQLESGESAERKYYPLNTVRDKDGADVLHRVNETFYSSDIIMPFVVCGENGRGFSMEFPVPSDLSDLGSVQNVNYHFSRISNETELQTHQIGLNADASFNDTVDLIIAGLEDGWAEAFDVCRRRWRQWYDFSEYEREDLQWFRKCPVHNFTFLYGNEAFDHENQKIDVERLVREGEEFGGFDTVILWNQYPRLGVDERTQWDFYDDFPGGRPALRKAIDELHAHGVKVLLPFIPWDRHEHEGTDSMGSELARLAADTGFDGLHLDTMKMFPHSAREKLDAVRPGIVLETQGHPMKKRSMEYITASWDEFWSADPMPEEDVLRFMNPQHCAPVIGRWLRNDDKDKLIKRASSAQPPSSSGRTFSAAGCRSATRRSSASHGGSRRICGITRSTSAEIPFLCMTRMWKMYSAMSLRTTQRPRRSIRSTMTRTARSASRASACGALPVRKPPSCWETDLQRSRAARSPRPSRRRRRSTFWWRATKCCNGSWNSSRGTAGAFLRSAFYGSWSSPR